MHKLIKKNSFLKYFQNYFFADLCIGLRLRDEDRCALFVLLDVRVFCCFVSILVWYNE